MEEQKLKDVGAWLIILAALVSLALVFLNSFVGMVVLVALWTEKIMLKGKWTNYFFD